MRIGEGEGFSEDKLSANDAIRAALAAGDALEDKIWDALADGGTPVNFVDRVSEMTDASGIDRTVLFIGEMVVPFNTET